MPQNFSLDLTHNVENLHYRYNQKTNAVYLLVLLGLGLALGSLPFVHVLLSSQSRGVVNSNIENVGLSAMVSGKVKSCALKNNQQVQQGDTLLVLEPAILETQTQAKGSILADHYAQLQDLKQLCAGNLSFQALKTSVFQQELAQFLQAVREVEVKEQQTARNFNRTQTLYQEGVLPKAEYETKTYEYQAVKANILSLRQKQQSTWQAKKREIEEQIKSMTGEVNQLQEEKKNYVLTAPIAGTLVNYSGIKTGAFLTAAQTVGTLSPDDEMVVECFVTPADIGFIKVGQTVNLQIDAYNYNQWGLAKGSVKMIDRNSTATEKEVYFKVRCALQTPFLQLKNGYNAEIKKGMTLTARFSLTERTLWDLLFDKVDDWFNPKIM